MILQFINIGPDAKMRILKQMLIMMRKLGDKFFITHVLTKQDPFVDAVSRAKEWENVGRYLEGLTEEVKK